MPNDGCGVWVDDEHCVPSPLGLIKVATGIVKELASGERTYFIRGMSCPKAVEPVEAAITDKISTGTSQIPSDQTLTQAARRFDRCWSHLSQEM